MIHRLNDIDYQDSVAYMARVISPIVAERKDTQAVPALIRNLYMMKNDAEAREIIVRALAQIGDQRAVLPCIHALRDTDREVATAAATALKTLTGQDFGVDHNKWVAWWLNTAK